MSFILEALRKSERQRRELEAQPLVRLAAYSGETAPSRWRRVILGLVIALNVAALAFFGWRWFGNGVPAEQAGPATELPSVTEGHAAVASQVVAGALSADHSEPAPVSLGFAEVHAPQAHLEALTKEDSPAARLKKFRAQPGVPRRPSPPVRPAPTPRAQPRTQPRESDDLAGDALDTDEAEREISPPRPSPSARPGKRGSPVARSRGAQASLASEPSPVIDDRFPQPKINVYAYSRTAEHERFIVIGGQKYHEGDRLADGPKVRRIEETAVTLDYQGQSYRVPRP